MQKSQLLRQPLVSQRDFCQFGIWVFHSAQKLSLVNCEPLLQRIKGKIGSWTAKYLSFAGRLQLLNSVISGITNFWCGAFILPKKCIELIDSMCSSYLWKGSIEPTHNAKIAWDRVTKPKEEGGLRVKNFLVWNRTCALKLFLDADIQDGFGMDSLDSKKCD